MKPPTGKHRHLPLPWWIRQSASGLVAILIGLSAIAVLLLTSGNGVVPVSMPASREVIRVPAKALAASREEPCACPGFSAGRGAMASPMEREGASRGHEDGRPDADLAQVSLSSTGAARASVWIMHNTYKLEHDPRAFLRLMSHLAHPNGKEPLRLPGKAPDYSGGKR